MNISIPFNNAWESVPFEFVDDAVAFLLDVLQPTHPLREYDLFVEAKCWRKDKYLLTEKELSDKIWVLDLERRRRVKGKTYFYFKLIESQEEMDEICQQDEEWWIQYMKDAGAWGG